MMREILLFQASDWAFMVHNGSADAYAKSRFQEHYENVLKLYDLTRSKEPDLKLLETMENKNNLFAWIGELF
jgi:1,4-alpha-glucan branching enzyme